MKPIALAHADGPRGAIAASAGRACGVVLGAATAYVAIFTHARETAPTLRPVRTLARRAVPVAHSVVLVSAAALVGNPATSTIATSTRATSVGMPAQGCVLLVGLVVDCALNLLVLVRDLQQAIASSLTASCAARHVADPSGHPVAATTTTSAPRVRKRRGDEA
eukprot:CAMPEP_0177180110 /NCGR_PEP_ID=MMETSP0367-20130122/15218_1 /TAXON_ID=447022 ORGANISM="Scrippsiella hangoei-like, Strain SHHI-4" /NCGR_SAMPLE_ID=MMETSP0367 /ASSEMBLY_ACC=CAM_ASM_000362 /LENGTH=163 /DNA_ID=CAMNT_0018626875 /DNA_START=185 /DNA_END=673 /DNA_ORIENTATION=+